MPPEIAPAQELPDLVWIPGGTFRMGSEKLLSGGTPGS